jgi:two-component system cell cycle response regulator DivK
VGQKILVVEDNELNLKLFCDLLRAHGYAAEPVRDGREAVARARDFQPDLIVMDIQMPHISGLELIEQMKGDAELRRVPIMAVTAYAAKGDEERIRDAGAEGYVSKPISLMKFIGSVVALLEAAAARPEEPEPVAVDDVSEGEAQQEPATEAPPELPAPNVDQAENPQKGPPPAGSCARGRRAPAAYLILASLNRRACARTGSYFRKVIFSVMFRGFFFVT